MGAGKTTIGRQLAKQLHRRFYDSDREIEKQTGANIPLIFELEQEEGFRRRETAMIDALTQRKNIVLATGGGAVLKSENRTFLRSRGHVIYLHAPIERLLERTSRDQNRPLLQTADPRKRAAFARRQAENREALARLFRSAGIDSIHLRTDQPYALALGKFFETREKRRLHG